MVVVGQIADGQHTEERAGVGDNSEQLGVERAVSKFLDDGGKEGARGREQHCIGAREKRQQV